MDIVVVLGLSAVTVVAVMVIGERQGGEEEVTRNDIRTMNGFRMALSFVDILKEDSGARSSSVPMTGEDLSQWILAHEWVDELLAYDLDIEKGRIRDAWGNDVLVIAIEGELDALASMGENGVWEDGFGDDIVVRRGFITKGGRLQGSANE